MESHYGPRQLLADFSSFVPFVPTPGLAVSGGTFVGLSVAVPLAELLGQPTDQDLQRRLRVIEYERIYQEKLTALRVLFGERYKRIAHLRVLDAQAKTAALELEKVRIGLALQAQGQVSLALDPIDLAQAEEKLARIEGDRQETKLEILNLETRMLGLVGAARVKP